MATLPLLFASLLSAALSTPATPSPRVSWANPINVHVMSVIGHPDVLAGERVKVVDARVKRVVGPRLAVVNEPRLRGIKNTYERFYELDELVLFLPGSVTVSPGQLIAVTGVVRSVTGGRVLGLPLDALANDRETRERTNGIGDEPLLVVDTIQTPDGAVLGVNATSGGTTGR